MKYSHILICCFSLLFVFQSCRKDIDIETEKEIVKGPSTQVIGSVFGIVKDELGIPVENALIRLSTHSTYSDENGVFQFENIALIQDYEIIPKEVSDVFQTDNEAMKLRGSFITVEKDGYFLGSRRFYPDLGSTNQVEIQLLEKELAGIYASNQETSIEIDHVKLSFPADAISTADGSNYSGEVHVFATYLDPTDVDVMRSMPGDLTGISQADGVVSLASYGMIAVELEDTEGNSLQISDGYFVTTTLEIPAALQGAAPATIPIWSFQETEGIWIEEGIAVLTGNRYVAEIPHFSFWNCDLPYPTIFLDGHIQNQNGALYNMLIKISVESLGIAASARSDINGDFSGYIPANEILLVEVYNACDEVFYSFPLGPLTANEYLEIMVQGESFSSLVEGTVTSCSIPPSTLTYIQASYDSQSQTIPLDDMNAFSQNLIYCDGDADIQVQAIDPVNGLVSSSIVMSLADTINFATIELCDTAYQEHYIMQYGNTTDLYTPTDASFSMASIDSFVDPATNLPTKYILGMLLIDYDFDYTLNIAWLVDLDDPEYMSNVSVFQAGFKASGIITSQIVYQNGIRWAIITGTLSEIEVTDLELYDPSFTELYLNIAAKI